MKTRLALLVIWLLCALAAVVGLVWMLIATLAGSRRAWKIAIGFDQMGNVVAGGDEDETISARCWRLRDEQPYGTLYVLIDAAFGDGHCCESFYAENDGR